MCVMYHALGNNTNHTTVTRIAEQLLSLALPIHFKHVLIYGVSVDTTVLYIVCYGYCCQFVLHAVYSYGVK